MRKIISKYIFFVSLLLFIFILFFFKSNKTYKSKISNLDKKEPDQSLNILYFKKISKDFELFREFEKKYKTKLVINTQENWNNKKEEISFESSFTNWLMNQSFIRNLPEQGMYRADLIFFNSIQELLALLERDLIFQTINPLYHDILQEFNKIPSHLKSEKYAWFPYKREPLFIIYNKKKVNLKKEKLTSYMDLANGIWKDRIVVPTSKDGQIQSLIAYMILVYGFEKTQTWAQKLIANLSQKPISSQEKVCKIVFQGEADITLMSASSFSSCLDSQKEFSQDSDIGIIHFNKNTKAMHSDIYGVSILKGAKNKKQAYRFIEYLYSQKVKDIYKEDSFYIPLEDEVSLDNKGIKLSTFPIESILAKMDEALSIFNSAYWD